MPANFIVPIKIFSVENIQGESEIALVRTKLMNEKFRSAKKKKIFQKSGKYLAI